MLILLMLVGTRSLATAGDIWTEPYPGIQHLYRTTSMPWRIHALIVDLDNVSIRIKATKYEHRARTTSSFASLYNCVAAINGDFSNASLGYLSVGLAIGDGQQWPGVADADNWGFVALGLDGTVHVSSPSEVINPAEPWMHEVVGGKPLVVANGVAVNPPTCGPGPWDPGSFCVRHPRTGVGISADGHTLILVVIDGRSSASIGATTVELGQVMASLGAHRAINLDGGGSSTMYVANEGGVVNVPSDGSERVVGNHLGIAIVSPFGTLTGVVRDSDITDSDANLAGATVVLSIGLTTVTNDNGLYVFDDVPAGDVTVTATYAGYLPGERSVYVPAGDTVWGSIALSPAPDAGANDIGGPDAGGAAGLDDSELTGGGCGYDAGKSVGAPYAFVLLLLLVTAGSRITRRRHDLLSRSVSRSGILLTRARRFRQNPPRPARGMRSLYRENERRDGSAGNRRL